MNDERCWPRRARFQYKYIFLGLITYSDTLMTKQINGICVRRGCWAKNDFNPFSYKGGSRKSIYKELCKSDKNMWCVRKLKKTKLVREHKMMMQSTAKEIDNKSSPALYSGQLPSVVFLFSSIFMKTKTKKKSVLL